MANQEAVAYLKNSLDRGHSLTAAKELLLQHGWSKEIIEEAARVVSPLPIPSPPLPVPKAPTHQSSQPVIPEHYTSPLSTLLALLLFFALLVFTNKFIDDVVEYIAPYAHTSVFEETDEYRKLQSLRSAATPFSEDINEYNREHFRLSNEYQARQRADRFKPIIIQAVVSVVFWIIAFSVHFIFKQHRRQFLVLSVTYFVVAGFYLLQALSGILKHLFDKNATGAIYVSLFLIIVVITGAFVVHQKYFKKS